MATPIGYVRVRKGTSNIDVPVYAPADVTSSELRIQADTGVLGCFRLVTPTSATPLRINTQDGIMGIDLTLDSGETFKNLLRHSQDFTQAVWSKGANTTGYNTGRITMNAGSGTFASQQVTVTAGQPYTLSCFATRTTTTMTNFTLTVGTSASSGDLFYSSVFTSTETETAFRMTFTPASSSIWVGIDNTGSATALDITAKMQLEQGSTGTAYEQRS